MTNNTAIEENLSEYTSESEKGRSDLIKEIEFAQEVERNLMKITMGSPSNDPLGIFRDIDRLLGNIGDHILPDRQRDFARQVESACQVRKAFLRSIDNIIENIDEYVIPEMKQEFASQFNPELLDSDYLLESLDKYIVPAKKQDFIYQLNLMLLYSQIALIEGWSADIHGWSGKQEIEFNKEWRELRAKAERMSWRIQLLAPSSPKDLEATLMWMTEQGDEADLDLLREVKQASSQASDVVAGLMKVAEERISKRVNSLGYTRDKGEEAYQLNKHEWDQEYDGQFIAIYRGQVIDADREESALVDRIMKAQEERGAFRAYIVEIGAQPLQIRMPHPGRRFRVNLDR